MSAITTSSVSTCPSHQESAWGAADARQERVVVEVVRNGIVKSFTHTSTPIHPCTLLNNKKGRERKKKNKKKNVQLTKHDAFIY